MKHLSVVLAIILGVAAGLGTLDSPAGAAGGGYVSKCGGGKIFLHAKEKRLLTLHNNARRNHALRTFCVSPALQRAARAHSRDMIQRDYFSHYTKGTNQGACARVTSFGYNWSSCAENIGYNSTPEGMFRTWMNSAGHRRNILDPKFREIGVGACTGNYFNNKTTMYTVDLGSRR
jgi:uncharacterized protein YkwD